MEVYDVTKFGKIDFVPFGAICGDQAKLDESAKKNYNGNLGDTCFCTRVSGGPEGQVSNDSGYLITPPDGYKGTKVAICKYNGQNGIADECGDSIADFTGKLPRWSTNSADEAGRMAQVKKWQDEYFGSS